LACLSATTAHLNSIESNRFQPDKPELIFVKTHKEADPLEEATAILRLMRLREGTYSFAGKRQKKTREHR
jgi:hypothetical protein